MSQCIYTGADEATESFSKAEHIFPKCIGGIHTLPRGWVCDRINHSFSALELGFARQNPTVAMTRMFLPPMDLGVPLIFSTSEDLSAGECITTFLNDPASNEARTASANLIILSCITLPRCQFRTVLL